MNKSAIIALTNKRIVEINANNKEHFDFRLNSEKHSSTSKKKHTPLVAHNNKHNSLSALLIRATVERTKDQK